VLPAGTRNVRFFNTRVQKLLRYGQLNQVEILIPLSNFTKPLVSSGGGKGIATGSLTLSYSKVY
jgi:hypothetical protein